MIEICITIPIYSSSLYKWHDNTTKQIADDKCFANRMILWIKFAFQYLWQSAIPCLRIHFNGSFTFTELPICSWQQQFSHEIESYSIRIKYENIVGKLTEYLLTLFIGLPSKLKVIWYFHRIGSFTIDH